MLRRGVGTPANGAREADPSDWQQFVKGSALHEAVKAGPDGSSFVSPSALPASSGSSPLQAPPANNWVSG